MRYGATEEVDSRDPIAIGSLVGSGERDGGWRLLGSQIRDVVYIQSIEIDDDLIT